MQFADERTALAGTSYITAPALAARPFAGMLLFLNASPEADKLAPDLSIFGARFATSLISCTHLLVDTSSPAYSSLLTSRPAEEQNERILAWLGRSDKILSYNWARAVCAIGLVEANRCVPPLVLQWPVPVSIAKVVLKKPEKKMEITSQVEVVINEESVEEKESRRPAPKGARKTKSGAARATWGQEAVDSLVYFLSTSSTPKEAFTSTSQRHPDKTFDACQTYYYRHLQARFPKKPAKTTTEVVITTGSNLWTEQEDAFLLQAMQEIPDNKAAIASFRQQYPNRSEASVVKRCWSFAKAKQQKADEEKSSLEEEEQDREEDEEHSEEEGHSGSADEVLRDPSSSNRRARSSLTSRVAYDDGKSAVRYAWSKEEDAFLLAALTSCETRLEAVEAFQAKYPLRSSSSTKKRAYTLWKGMPDALGVSSKPWKLKSSVDQGMESEELTSEDEIKYKPTSSRRRSRASDPKEDEGQAGGSKRTRLRSPSNSVPSLSSSLNSRHSLDHHPSTPPSPRLSATGNLTHLSLTAFPTNSADYIATFIKPLSLASFDPLLPSFINFGVPPPNLPPGEPSSSRRNAPTLGTPFCYFCGSFTSSSIRIMRTAVMGDDGIREEEHGGCLECEETFERAEEKIAREDDGSVDKSQRLVKATEEVTKRGILVRRAKMRMEGWK